MSADADRLKVVLCWHMHQPDYRGPEHSDYQLPWVYLHGIKDYVDMAAHLEANPEARAVVNFAPVLLEQIDDYAEQVQAFEQHGRPLADPLLAALAGPGLPADPEARQALVSACLRANETRLINRFAPYRELVDLAGWFQDRPGSALYLSDQYLVDLLVWYHLAWMGESVRQTDLRVAALEKKARGFDGADRRRLVGLIGELMGGIVGRYRALAENGRVELSVTPYAHPIIPLLLDIRSARDALPDIPLPELAHYPGGEERARWHIRHGIEVFRAHFGFTPRGCWPSEGAVSEGTLRLLEEEGVKWAASGQQVLHNTLSATSAGQFPDYWPHRAYRVQERRVAMFFRDDGLSDLIGFTYADWHADDAVGDLLQHLENVARATQGKSDAVVAIIMDGENAWEYYPSNGHYFLSALYKRLAEHPELRLTTFSDCVERCVVMPWSLPRLVAGSWGYGTLSTWIGDKDKNRGWDMLGDAKQAYDRAVAAGRLSAEQREAAALQLATCEGSDWFWWFGDYNPASAVSDFERLFRRQLKHLYELLGEPAPPYLLQAFAHGTGDPSRGGVMRQSH
jgi:alpha-amylase/alpha-mannosidase (GH57 family)